MVLELDNFQWVNLSLLLRPRKLGFPLEEEVWSESDIGKCASPRHVFWRLDRSFSMDRSSTKSNPSLAWNQNTKNPETKTVVQNFASPVSRVKVWIL